jgi:hypothetical protein
MALHLSTLKRHAAKWIKALPIQDLNLSMTRILLDWTSGVWGRDVCEQVGVSIKLAQTTTKLKEETGWYDPCIVTDISKQGLA